MRAHVAEHGAANWGLCAERVGTRPANRCQERWREHLAPGIEKGDWTSEEDITLVDAVSKKMSWADISSKLLPSRPPNLCKIRYKSLSRKHK